MVENDSNAQELLRLLKMQTRFLERYEELSKKMNKDSNVSAFYAVLVVSSYFVSLFTDSLWPTAALYAAFILQMFYMAVYLFDLRKIKKVERIMLEIHAKIKELRGE